MGGVPKIHWLYTILLPLFLVVSCDSRTGDAATEKGNVALDDSNANVHFKDSVLLEQILEKSKFYGDTDLQDSIFKYDRLLKDVATKANYLPYKAKGESYLAYDFREIEQYDSAFYYYNRARNTYKLLADSTQVGRKLIEMGKIQYRQADYYGSKESVTEALQYLQLRKDSLYWPVALNELGHNYFALKDYTNAQKCYEEAIAYEQNPQHKILYKNNLANLYSENQQEDLAIRIFEEVLEDLPTQFDKMEYARLVHNLAVARWKCGYQNVFGDFQEALKIRKTHNDQWGLLSSYASLLYYYFDTDKATAIRYADSLIQVSKTTHTPNSEKEALTALLQLQPNNTQVKDRYIFVSDSLAKNELKVKNQFAFFRYQNQLEKDQILNLQAQNAERKAKLAEQRTQKIIFLGVIGLLLLTTVFIVNYLKQRHSKETLQEVFNTEKRISQRLHDELANDVFGLMIKAENKNPIKNTEFLKRLESIYARVRTISHENNPIHSKDDFLEDLKDLIKSFDGNEVRIIVKGLEDIQWELLEEKKCAVFYRTINELLVNMKKHSKASLVGLQFSYYKKYIRLAYKDNGRGLSDDTRFGFGLSNTDSRIRNCKGTFNFTSKQGDGVSVEVLIPT